MSVHKDEKRGTWFFRTRINELQFSRSGFATKKEAQKEEQLFIDNFNPGYSKMRVDELISLYLSFSAINDKIGTTYDKKNIITQYIQPVLGSYLTNEVLPKHIVAWQKSVNKKGLSYNYKIKIMNVLISLFGYGIKYHGLEKNPCDGIPRFKDDEIQHDEEYWTYDEFSQFIASVDDAKWKLLFSTLYYTGLRKGELRALTWKDIDGNEIVINKTCSSKGTGGYVISTPKTKSSRRRVLMPGFLVDMLNTYKEDCMNVDGFSDSCFIFGITSPVPETTLARWMAHYCKVSGVKKIRIHDLRHSHASLLINSGASILVVSKRLGHSDIKMTLNTYSHMFPSEQLKAVQKLTFPEKCSNNVPTVEDIKEKVLIK